MLMSDYVDKYNPGCVSALVRASGLTRPTVQKAADGEAVSLASAEPLSAATGGVVSVPTLLDPSSYVGGATAFSCPTCKSSYFGTRGVLTEDEERHCKGHLDVRDGSYDYTGCTFTWPPKDDAKYMAAPVPNCGHGRTHSAICPRCNGIPPKGNDDGTGKVSARGEADGK